jgi:glutamate-ammonia-ligase adenylyltransferase
VAILGMGKLGSRELTAGSDVDLILLYDHDADAEESDGDKPLAPSHYYGRMTQRLIAAVSAPTAEGVLYELDLRLRPSGNKGPVATHVDAFKKYQRGEAWTWEHMALTRARVVVAGDAELAAEIETEVQELLALPRDPKKIAAEAVEMRAMIEKEKPARDIWDIKLIPGGLIDLEFIAQVAVLCGRLNGERVTGTAKTLARLSPDFADSQTKRDLTEAYALYLALTQMIRLCLTGPFEKEDSPPGLVDLLLAATDLPDIKVLEAHLKETAAKVRSHFNRLLGAGRKSS